MKLERFRIRRTEFWVGVFLSVSSIIAIAIAVMCPSFRLIVKDIGPTIAVPGVVGASLIAYAAAVARIDFDVWQLDRNKTEEYRAILVRLGFSASNIMHQVRHNVLVYKNEADGQGEPIRHLVGSEIDILEPEEFIDAWKRISILPEDVRHYIERIKPLISEVNRNKKALVEFYGAGDMFGQEVIRRARVDAVLNRYIGLEEETRALSACVQKYVAPPQTS